MGRNHPQAWYPSEHLFAADGTLATESMRYPMCEGDEAWLNTLEESASLAEAAVDHSGKSWLKSLSTTTGLLGLFTPETTMAIADAIGESIAPDSAARAAYRVHDAFADAVTASPNALVDLADSRTLKETNAALGGVLAGFEARERGMSVPASVVDGIVVAALAKVEFAKPIDSLINVVNDVTKLVSPEAAKYTEVIAALTPSKLMESGLVGLVDTADGTVAAMCGDSDQLLAQSERNLMGGAGPVLQVGAVAAETIGATLTDDRETLNQISDWAADGTLGVVMQHSDAAGSWFADSWLGEKLWDLFGDSPDADAERGGARGSVAANAAGIRVIEDTYSPDPGDQLSSRSEMSDDPGAEGEGQEDGKASYPDFAPAFEDQPDDQSSDQDDDDLEQDDDIDKATDGSFDQDALDMSSSDLGDDDQNTNADATFSPDLGAQSDELGDGDTSYPDPGSVLDVQDDATTYPDPGDQLSATEAICLDSSEGEPRYDETSEQSSADDAAADYDYSDVAAHR